MTSKAESVNNVFAVENEKLRTKLHVIQNNQIQHLTDTRMSILKYFDDWSEWVNNSLHISNLN